MARKKLKETWDLFRKLRISNSYKSLAQDEILQAHNLRNCDSKGYEKHEWKKRFFGVFFTIFTYIQKVNF